MTLFGSPLKIWVSARKICGLNEKLGVSNDNLGFSNEKLELSNKMVVMVGFYKAETDLTPNDRFL